MGQYAHRDKGLIDCVLFIPLGFTFVFLVVCQDYIRLYEGKVTESLYIA